MLRFMVPESKVFKIKRDKRKDISFFVEVSCVLFATFLLQFAINRNATRILPATRSRGEAAYIYNINESKKYNTISVRILNVEGRGTRSRILVVLQRAPKDMEACPLADMISYFTDVSFA